MSKELPLYKVRVHELRDAVERLMDGDEPETLFVGRVRMTPEVSRSTGSSDFPEHASIRFHQPARRAHRLATADGRTSFHFSHRTVVRLRSGSFYDGVLLRPGAAREHCRYVERESAVASIALDPPSAASSLIADRSDNLQAYVETDDDLRPYAHHPAVADRAIFAADGIYSTDLYVAEARSAADGLRSLPGFDMAAEGWQADLLLHGVPGGELERGGADLDGALRRPADTSERDSKVAIPATPAIDGAPAIRDSRIDGMALALKGMKVDPPSTSRSGAAEKPPFSQAPQPPAPATRSEGPSSAAPILPATPAIPATPRVHSVQRLIDDKIMLRLDSNSEIDARALARQGITIADADRRNARLVGRAQEQRRHARQVVETFVTKHPGFIVEANDVCSLSSKTKPDVLEFFKNHDGPGMQAMLRRIFDRHQTTDVSRVPGGAAAPAPDVTPAQRTPSSATSTLERDPAMIAAAQGRLREIEREQANAAARLAAAKHPAKDIAPEKSDRPAGPPTSSTPGPKRPPPGWNGGFGR